MKQPKSLLPWGATTLLQHVVQNWRASQVQHVLVVLHPDDEQLAQQCPGALTVVCDPPPPEMKDSIVRGIRAAEEVFHAAGDDAWLVAPADMPNISAEVIDRLISAYRTALSHGPVAPAVWIAEHEGRTGHPVLLPWRLAAELKELKPHESLKTLIARWPSHRIAVPTSAIFADVDTPEDYRRNRPADLP